MYGLPASLGLVGGGSTLAVSASADVSAGDTSTEFTFIVDDDVSGGSGVYTYAWAFTGGDADTGSETSYTWDAAGAKFAVVTVTERAAPAINARITRGSLA